MIATTTIFQIDFYNFHITTCEKMEEIKVCNSNIYKLFEVIINIYLLNCGSVSQRNKISKLKFINS